MLIAAQPTRGLDVGAIEFVHRRLVAERDAGRGVLLVSLEFEEVRALADRIVVIYEGEIVGEFPPDVSEEELGIMMTGGGRQRSAAAYLGPDLEPQAGQALAGEPGPEVAAMTPAARLAGYVRGGGVIVPVLTALLAFFVGGLVILVTGHNPLSTYKAIFNGTGLNWFFPWTSGDDRTTAALNLQQTLIITTPLILVGLAVAFAFRAGLFNIGGQGQYLVGSYFAVWVGSSFAGMPKLLHIVVAIVARGAGGRGLGRASPGCSRPRSAPMRSSRRSCSTGSRCGSASTCSGSTARCRTPTRSSSRSPSPATSRAARSCRCSGATRSCRGCTWGSSSRSPPSSSSGSCSTARRPATRCARWASTPRPRATAASASRATTSS